VPQSVTVVPQKDSPVFRGAALFLQLFMFSFPRMAAALLLPRRCPANEMIVLRWLHLIFGIIWIGLLYFLNLVLTPAMKKCDPKLRIKIYPELMPGTMGWFRSSALVTVIVDSATSRSIWPRMQTCWRPFADWEMVRLVAAGVGRRVCVHLRAAASGERIA